MVLHLRIQEDHPAPANRDVGEALEHGEVAWSSPAGVVSRIVPFQEHWLEAATGKALLLVDSTLLL